MTRHPEIDRILKSISEIHVDLPLTAAVHQKLSAAYDRRLVAPCPITSLIGASALGKSMALKSAAGLIRSEKFTAIRGRVLYVELLSQFDGKDLQTKILSAAGAPSIHARNVGRRADNLVKQLSLRRVDTLVVDNAHHLVSQGEPNRDALQILAHLAAAGGRSIVLSGRETMAPLTHDLGWIVGRNVIEIPVDPLPHQNLRDLMILEDFIVVAGHEIATRVNPLELDIELMFDRGFAKRLFLAARGAIGAVMLLIQEAVADAAGKRKSVRLEDFAEAWRLHLSQSPDYRQGLRQNPFLMDDVPSLTEIHLAMRPQKFEADNDDLPSKPTGKGVRIWAR